MQAPYQRNAETNVMQSIREDMAVFGQDGKRIGNVKYVQFSDGADDVPPDARDRLAHIPTAVQSRLFNTGFIQIDCGLLQPDCYATPDQIASIQEDGVRLNVGRDQLMTF